MNFKTHTQEELLNLDIEDEKIYTIQYMNRDYFNAQENLEISKAKAVKHGNEIVFVVSDPYGMDKFIKEARVIL